jgi:hypothetical protein
VSSKYCSLLLIRWIARPTFPKAFGAKPTRPLGSEENQPVNDGHFDVNERRNLVSEKGVHPRIYAAGATTAGARLNKHGRHSWLSLQVFSTLSAFIMVTCRDETLEDC